MISLLVVAGALITIAAVIVAILSGLYDIFVAFRAKRAARALIKREGNGFLHGLASLPAGRQLSEIETAQAAAAIRMSTKDLDASYRKSIERGLTQKSRSGERRFIMDLIEGA